MPTATVPNQVENADQLFLRWSDDPTLPMREQRVEMVRLYSSESIIRSALRINEKTKVLLIGNHYTRNGIVRSCREEGDSFLLTILIDPEHSGPELLPEYDPGLFGVDDFLTEEEESKILEDLNADSNIRRGISWIPKKIEFVFREVLTNLRMYSRLPSTVSADAFQRAC
jgi:hypothetical protein